MNDREKRPLLFGQSRPDRFAPIVTRARALQIARRNMPADLKRAGFRASIFASDSDIHGGLWWRVNYGRVVPS